ncbi:cytochrome c-type biogenesis protein CcmH [Brevundimonas sp. 2R-24]|uniref:Cytochrome c-type biogenesis protein n=1 Tax=Peiella sedimenti TaxID=3061083 RepID=A0ABT8SHT2_9CAUL|nr:cytochrome c-type biogenesis protein CcmH [Caulobacteraceae bacterium XZ-24]
MRGAALILAAALLAGPVAAQEPPPPPERSLSDPAQEARAQALFRDIRCVVCQNESIADSQAGIAGDLRRRIREEVAAGRSDQTIKADLQRLYGDFVLLKPPVGPRTWLLWGAPFLLIVIGGAAILMRLRRSPAGPEPTGDGLISAQDEGPDAA